MRSVNIGDKVQSKRVFRSYMSELFSCTTFVSLLSSVLTDDVGNVLM